MNIPCAQLTDDLNNDLEREYQAVMTYVAHVRRLESARDGAIPAESETHTREALQRALTICTQVIDQGLVQKSIDSLSLVPGV